jgi:hypothetical protein
MGRVMAAKLTRLTQKIAILWQLVAEAVLNKILSGNQLCQMNKKTDVLRTISVFMIMIMMKTETVLETSVSFIRLTQLIA